MIRRLVPSLACGLAALCAPLQAGAGEVSRRPFGALADGSPVEALTLTNRRGVSATVLTYGATLQALLVPDRRGGGKTDIVLGYADADAYERHANYLGASVGRYANRIGKGRFTLDGATYQLALNNNGVAALHGGAKGFDKRTWRVAAVHEGPTAAVTLAYVSPDGEEGYPGTLSATAEYRLDAQNRLTIVYTATTDKPTIVNLTNHALFNLAGEGSAGGVMGQVLQLFADAYSPVDAELIPTGESRPVAGTPFDFRTPRVIGERIRDAADPQLVIGRGYDHNYVLRGSGLRPIARLSDPVSGRTLELSSDQPGVQVYSGNFLDGTTIGKRGRLYRQGDGLALEPQRFPDAPNKPQFGPVRLDPGQTYSNTLVLHLIP